MSILLVDEPQHTGFRIFFLSVLNGGDKSNIEGVLTFFWIYYYLILKCSMCLFLVIIIQKNYLFTLVYNLIIHNYKYYQSSLTSKSTKVNNAFDQSVMVPFAISHICPTLLTTGFCLHIDPFTLMKAAHLPSRQSWVGLSKFVI